MKPIAVSCTCTVVLLAASFATAGPMSFGMDSKGSPEDMSNTHFTLQQGEFLVQTGGNGPFGNSVIKNIDGFEFKIIKYNALGITEKSTHKTQSIYPEGFRSLEGFAAPEGFAGPDGFGPNNISETDLATVPEPASLTLLGLGLASAATSLRRRRKAREQQ